MVEVICKQHFKMDELDDIIDVQLFRLGFIALPAAGSGINVHCVKFSNHS